MDCGPTEAGINELATSRYTQYAVYLDQRLVLCDFCAVDFGSYNPMYFGFQNDKKLDLHVFNFIGVVKEPALHFDKVCPECAKRLVFLNFVAACRLANNHKPNDLR